MSGRRVGIWIDDSVITDTLLHCIHLCSANFKHVYVGITDNICFESPRTIKFDLGIS